MELSQYDVVLVNLDPTIGREIKKTRPCLIISPDEMNRHLSTIIVAPMTTSKNDYPSRVKVKFQKVEGRIALDQIRTIDRRRIVKSLGYISKPEIENVKGVLMEMLVE